MMDKHTVLLGFCLFFSLLGGDKTMGLWGGKGNQKNDGGGGKQQG